MKLVSLEIKLQPSWESNAGKYVATVEYETRQSTVKLVLDPSVSTQLLGFIGPVITQAAGKAAREIESNIVGSLEEMKTPAIELTNSPV